MLVFRSTKSLRNRSNERKESFASRFDRVAPSKKEVDFQCVLTIWGESYDLSSWANAHPGGALILRKWNGKDATNAFERIGHSRTAYNMLKDFSVSKEKVKRNAGESADEMQLKPKEGTWKKKLFTREDPQNVHKFCGFFVLLHYAFRFYQMLFGDLSAGFGSRMGHGATVIGPLCLIPHALLSLSSLIFHTVPKERIVGQPMIWREFRAHSIIFAMRSIIGTLCAWISVYSDHQPIVRKMAVFISSLSILVANYSAETATRKLCPSNLESTTATMPYWEGATIDTQRRFKSFYAYCQFLATLACLAMCNPAWPFAVMLPIQLAAFLMTMVRKGFLSAKSYHVLYTLSLMMPYVVAVRDMIYTKTAEVVFVFIVGYLLYRLRCRGVGKYYLWVPLVVLRILVGDQFISYKIW